MAERLTTCPECVSTKVKMQKMHNPETQDMNARATLRCEECKHVWEGEVTSPHLKEQRRRGFVL